MLNLRPKENIHLILPIEDLKFIEKIFDEIDTDNPKFTIVKKEKINNEDDGYWMIEIFIESYAILWYLAKKIECMQFFSNKINL